MVFSKKKKRKKSIFIYVVHTKITNRNIIFSHYFDYVYLLRIESNGKVMCFYFILTRNNSLRDWSNTLWLYASSPLEVCILFRCFVPTHALFLCAHKLFLNID